MKRFLFLIVIIFSLGTILPLFHQGLFPIHDDTQVARVLTMSNSLRDGMIPVRWVNLLGYNYGYPIFNFYAPLAYYIGAILSLMGFGVIGGTKVMFGLGMVVAGLTMYFLASSIFSKKAGIVASIFYLYAPYHALDLYVRGAIGELWAYALLPLPFWGLWKLYATKRFRYVILTSLGLALIIISHNLTALMVMPFLVIFAVILSTRGNKKRTISSQMFGSIILGVLLSGFYFLPALLELKYTNVSEILGGGSNPLDHFVCLSQLWQGRWGYGGSVPGCVDGMSFILGKLHILAIVGGLISTWYFWSRKEKQLFYLSLSILSCLAVSLFLTLSISQPIWKSIGVMKYFQFPWRFLVIAACTSSLLAGLVVKAVETKNATFATVLSLLLVVGVIGLDTKYFKPQNFITDTSAFTQEGQIVYSVSKISDEYLPQGIIKPKTSGQVPHTLIQPTQGTIDSVLVEASTQKKKISLVVPSQTSVKLNLAFFPAWQISLDNKHITPQVSHGLYVLSLPKGEHQITADFVQTPVEKLGNSMTLVGICLSFVGIIVSRRAKTL